MLPKKLSTIASIITNISSEESRLDNACCHGVIIRPAGQNITSLYGTCCLLLERTWEYCVFSVVLNMHRIYDGCIFITMLSFELGKHILIPELLHCTPRCLSKQLLLLYIFIGQCAPQHI